MSIYDAAQNMQTMQANDGPGAWGKFFGGLQNYGQGVQQRLSGQAPALSGIANLAGWQMPQFGAGLQKKLMNPMSQSNVMPAAYGANSPNAYGGNSGYSGYDAWKW